MSNGFTIRGAGRLAGAVLAVTAICTLGGCGSRVQTFPTVHNASLSMPQAHESTNVSKGQTLTVNLPTHGGSSHSWRISPSSASNKLVKLQSRRSQIAPNGHTADAGQPAYDIFMFNANHSGTVTLDFIYDCPYSVDQAPARQLALDVNVYKPGQETPSAPSTSFANVEPTTE
jgi:predicted secreted protein